MNETLLIGCGNLGYSVVEAFLKKKKKKNFYCRKK